MNSKFMARAESGDVTAQMMQMHLGNEAVKRQQDLKLEELSPILLRNFQGHRDKITQVIFNPNLKQLISSS
jgi:hypothetical protein